MITYPHFPGDPEASTATAAVQLRLQQRAWSRDRGFLCVGLSGLGIAVATALAFIPAVPECVAEPWQGWVALTVAGLGGVGAIAGLAGPIRARSPLVLGALAGLFVLNVASWMGVGQLQYEAGAGDAYSYGAAAGPMILSWILALGTAGIAGRWVWARRAGRAITQARGFALLACGGLVGAAGLIGALAVLLRGGLCID